MKNEDINRRLQELMNIANKSGALQNLIRSPEGRRLAGGLSDAQKQKLMQEFSKMDQNEIRKKLSGITAQDLRGLSPQQLVDMIKKK